MTPQDPQRQGQPQPNPSNQPPRPQGGQPVGPQYGQPGAPTGPQPPMQGQPPRPQPGPSAGQPGGQPGNQPPMRPMQGPPGPGVPPNSQPNVPPTGQPNSNRPDYQWQPNQPPNQAGGATTATAAKPAQGFGDILAALRPEPAKAPPLEWVGLAVSVILAICGFLPWVNAADGTSFGGTSVNDGWIVFGAGLLAAILGFIGLSRDSISLAAGQALLGLIALGFAIINMTGLVSGESAAFGLILTLVVSVIVIGLGVYNAIDAARKGAKY